MKKNISFHERNSFNIIKLERDKALIIRLKAK